MNIDNEDRVQLEALREDIEIVSSFLSTILSCIFSFTFYAFSTRILIIDICLL